MVPKNEAEIRIWTSRMSWVADISICGTVRTPSMSSIISGYFQPEIECKSAVNLMYDSKKTLGLSLLQ